jgi:predicted RNA methylase
MTSRIEHHRPQYPDLFGQFTKSYHLEMVSDKARTEAISTALQQVLVEPDAVFCELGCGTGLFTIQAAQSCQKAYAVEIDPVMVEVARTNFAACRFRNRIELIPGDAMELNLPHSAKADVVLCEMMSIWCIEEPQVPVANRARREFLKDGGVLLPQRIVNLVELGSYNFRPNNVAMEAAIPLFTGIMAPAIMTERRLCKVLDFANLVNPDLSVALELEAVAAGVINCAILTSIVQLGPRVVFSGSDSLMPSTIVPLQQPITVAMGDRIRFRAAVRAWSDMGEATFVAEVENRSS